MNETFLLILGGTALATYIWQTRHITWLADKIRILEHRNQKLKQERDTLAERVQVLEISESNMTPAQQRAVQLGLAFAYDGRLFCKLDELDTFAKECRSFDLEAILKGLAESNPESRVCFTSSASYTSVYNIIEQLKDAVSAVRVTSRPAEINIETLRRSLVFELIFPWGTVELAGLWTAWQKIRADEMFSTFGELIQHGLADKMVIAERGGSGRCRFPITADNSLKIVQAVLALADHNHYIMGEIPEWVEELEWNFLGTTKYRAALDARIRNRDNPTEPDNDTKH